MKERILEVLGTALPQIDFTTPAALVDDGLLDSLSVVTLISELSMEFGIVFDLDELTPENLNTIDAITETVKRLKDEYGKTDC